MIIGLTGENCSGKGTGSNHLIKKGFHYFSLSDVIREELKKEGKEPTRESMVAKGNELRQKNGAILAIKIIERLEKDRNYIIDSIRLPAEVKELKKLNGFFLVYITASKETRFERMNARGRIGDPTTFEEFLRIEKIEEQNADKKKQNLKETAKLADKTLMNDGSFTNLYDNVDKMLSELSSDFKLVRPSWDEYFMSIAKTVATRSNCIKRKVAAIIVKDKRIISTGYNGTPRGIKNCSDGGCERCASFGESGKNLADCVCCHGEENAIVQASYHGVPIKDATIYSTFSPCLLCTKMIINSGIKEVVYSSDYPLADISLKLLKEAGILVRKHPQVF